MLERVLRLIAVNPDAPACAEEMARCRTLAAEGTSADAQLRIFSENEHEGADIALYKVSQWIREATLVA
jgi:hypothetical protein